MQRLNIPRFAAELAATLLIAEAAVMFTLPRVAPGIDGTAESVLDAALLALLAGPIILWRLVAASRRAGRSGPGLAEGGSDRANLAALLVLLAGLAFTASTMLGAAREIRHEAQARFEQVADHLQSEVQRRVNRPANALRSIRGLYAAHPEVNRAGFAAFVASRDLPGEFPGVLGFGFIQRVPAAELDDFIAAQKADGAPDFKFRIGITALSPTSAPTAARAEPADHYIVKHIEPREPNHAAWGFDIGTEPIRLEAARRAIAAGEPTISGRIPRLSHADASAGFLYFLPIFRSGAAPATPAEREAALIGLAYAPIVLEEVVKGLIEGLDGAVDVEIFDGDQPVEAACLLHGLNPAPADQPGRGTLVSVPGMFHRQTLLPVGGRQWLVATRSTPRFEAGINWSTPALIGAGGGVLSLLLSGLVWSLGASRSKAQALAVRMTAELRAAAAHSERLALIARETSNAVVITDPRGRIEWVNEAFTRISGYTLGEVLGCKPGDVLRGPATDPVASAAMGRAQREGTGCKVSLVNYAKGGDQYVIAIEIVPLRDATGQLTGFMAIESDITAQRTAEDQLRLANQRFEFVVNGTTDGVWDWNLLTNQVSYAPRFKQVLGYSAGDPEFPDTYESFASRLHPADAPAVEVAIRESIDRDAPYHAQFRLRTREGAWRWFEARGAVQRNAAGKAVRMAGSNTDITVVRELEQERLTMTAMLGTTARLARVGGWEVEVATGAARWTDMVYDIHEVERGTPIHLELGMSFYTPEVRERIAAAMHDAATLGTPFDLELPLTTAKGRPIWVRALGEAIREDGRIVRIAGAFQDITAAREAAEDLHAAKSALEEAQAVARMGSWSFDPATGQASWSRQLYRLFGMEPGHGPLDLDEALAGYHPGDRPILDAAIQKATIEGAPYTLTLRTRPGISARHIRTEGRARRDMDGNIVELHGTVTDVSTEVEREEALQIAQHAAESANRSKSAFLANMSHEIRTPLTAILGFADMLRDEGDLAQAPEHRVRSIETIRSAGLHLLTVINDILDLSKIEADRMTVERVETPLIALLRDIEDLIRPKAAAKGVQLSAALASPLPDRIVSDPTRLRQILMNLLGNAVKFTENGAITITAGACAGPAGQRLCIDIADSGPGMTQEQAQRLFQPFGQADETVARKYGGTGLGLVICRRLADLMGGSVTLARTAPGEGSVFRIELPLEPLSGAAMVSSLELPAAAMASALPGSACVLSGRILLAEDGVDNQRLIAFHLRKAGAVVDIADNGVLALQAIDRAAAAGTPYDLLLTDMQMPEMDGYTLARTLRQRGSEMPIIALTAHAMSEDRAQCTQAGCDDYATKPIDRRSLLDTCARWMNPARKARA